MLDHINYLNLSLNNEFKKPAFWDQANIPMGYTAFTCDGLYCLILAARRVIKNPRKFNIKTICIGNIYLGGTGKTPLAIKMASLLQDKFNLVIVKKEYSDQKDEIAMLQTKLQSYYS